MDEHLSPMGCYSAVNNVVSASELPPGLRLCSRIFEFYHGDKTLGRRPDAVPTPSVAPFAHSHTCQHMLEWEATGGEARRNPNCRPSTLATLVPHP